VHYLSPDVIQCNWTIDEDEHLIQKVEDLGRRWRQLEAYFPGRTDISLKNRYNVLQRKSAKQLKIALQLPLKLRRNPVVPHVQVPIAPILSERESGCICDQLTDEPDIDELWEPGIWPDLQFL
jgi:hypothetical protein